LSKADRKEREDPLLGSLRSMTKMIPMIDTRVMQQTATEVLESLNEPGIRDDIKKTVDMSYTTYLQVAQSLVRLSQGLMTGNPNQLSAAIKETVPAIARTNASMMVELATLNQKYASKTMEALEKGTRKKETKKPGVRT
jgi:hypothetical protein